MQIYKSFFSFYLSSALAIVFAVTSFACISSCVADDGQVNGKRQSSGNLDSNLANLYTPYGRPKTFVDRQSRETLKSIEIYDRPNRPLHFYGNVVRRRANTAGSARDFNQPAIRR